MVYKKVLGQHFGAPVLDARANNLRAVNLRDSGVTGPVKVLAFTMTMSRVLQMANLLKLLVDLKFSSDNN